MLIIDARTKIYIDNTINLISSLVIKSSYTAKQYNNIVSVKAPTFKILDDQPKTWKYYLNLAGEYHPTDTVMTIKSMDTLENIIFNKENIKLHKLTKRKYSYGTREYETLVSNYPDQELLIKGILNPTDIDVAINYNDFTIINYNSKYVEKNEYNLIQQIQNWIDEYTGRYYNVQYLILDNLYHITFIGLMYHRLLSVIIKLRLQNCKTNNVHSYHLDNYLRSYGFIENFINYLTLKQKLFFYRNLPYFRRYPGRMFNLHWLINRLLTERGINITELNFKQNSVILPETLSNTTYYSVNPLNYDNFGQDKVNYPLPVVLDKEKPLARRNIELRPDFEPNILKKQRNSLNSSLKTKALESKMIDYTDSEPNKIHNTALAHWFLMVDINRYKAAISFTNPVTKETMSLKAKDAIILLHYAAYRTNDCGVPKYIPKFYANRCLRFPLISYKEAMECVNPKLVFPIFAETAWKQIPSIPTIYSIEDFWEQVVEIDKANKYHRKMLAYIEHFKARGQADLCIENFFAIRECQFAPSDKTFDSWLDDNRLNFDKFTKYDFGILWENIINSGTGLTFDNRQTLGDIQKQMCDLLLYLSSYSIQIIREINSDVHNFLDSKLIMVGDIKSITSTNINNLDTGSGFKVLGNRNKEKVKASIDFGFNSSLDRVKNKAKEIKYGIDMNLNIKYKWKYYGGGSIVNTDAFNFMNVTIKNLKTGEVINPYPSNHRPIEDVYGNDQ